MISGATGTKQPLRRVRLSSGDLLIECANPEIVGFWRRIERRGDGHDGAQNKSRQKGKSGNVGHDGFQELYGGGGARKQKQQQQQQKIVQPWEAIGKPSGGDLREKLKKPGGDLRSAISKQKPKGDLRAKLLHSNKQIQKQADLRARIGHPKLERNLPKQCPW